MARAKAKAKPAEDAERNGASAMREEWSCPLCTLLNKWDTKVCGACAQERPEGVAPVPNEWTCGACTLVNEWTDERCAACFQERPPANTISGPTGHQVLDASDTGRSHSFGLLTDDTVPSRTTESSETEASSRSSSRRASRKRPLSPQQPRREVKAPTRPTVNDDDLLRVQARDEEAEAEAVVLPEAPTFNLLGFMNPPENPDNKTYSIVHDESTHPERPSFSLLGESAAIDLTSVPDADPPKPDITEAKLAQAGLDLSDSDSEGDGRKRHKLRRKSLTKPTTPDTKVAARAANQHSQTSDNDAEWDCEVCTERNAAHLDRCELCNSKRDQLSSAFKTGRTTPVPATAQETRDKKIECVVCTHMNPPTADNCELCDVQIEKVPCSVCAHMNPHSFKRCELCESDRRSAISVSLPTGPNTTATTTAKQVACPVCTNLNDPHLENCEMCETNLALASRPRRQTARYDLIDLASSQPDDKGHSGSDSEEEYDPQTEHGASPDFDDDFEHIYPSRAQSPEYSPSPPRPRSPPRRRQRDRTNYDRIEDISDNEMHGGMRSNFEPPPPRSKRPELTEFQHFLSVEDTRLDYQCQIDYRSMFAESSGSRTYADRLQKRRRESQKRKRTHAQNDMLSQDDAPTRRGKKKKKSAAKASGKRVRAAPRRASTGPPAAKKAYPPKRGPTAKPRRASAPTYASGVNHYDTASGDLGDDVTTMAWEGLGSAGYF